MEERVRTGLCVCTSAVGESMRLSLSVRWRFLPCCEGGRNAAEVASPRWTSMRGEPLLAMMPLASGEARSARARWFCASVEPYDSGWYGPARRWYTDVGGDIVAERSGSCRRVTL